MSEIIHASCALLPQGWAQHVCVHIGDDGRIKSVLQNAQQKMPGETFSGILLPSPANAHSHAFQRAMAGLTERRGPDPRDSFWSWRRLMYRFMDTLSADEIEAIAAFVQMEMLEAGYATNVEFHYVHNQSGGRPYNNPAELSTRIVAASEVSGIGLTLLPVHYEFGGCDQQQLSGGQLRFGTDIDSFATLWTHAGNALKHLPEDAVIGVAAHSLRAVKPDNLQALLAIAADAPFHLHLAEQLAEVEEVQQAYGARPVEWLLKNFDVDPRWCLIHCTQMLPHETSSLAATGAVAGLCPVTESSLGDGIFDGVNFVNSGGTLAIGSDSNIRISLSEELRTLDYSQRLRDHSRAALASATYSTGRRLYDAAVAGGAMAAGRNTGKIAVDQWADLLILNEDHADLNGRSDDTLLDSFIFAGDDLMITDVWSAGRHQVRAGQHINHEAIVKRYKTVMTRLAAAL